MVVTIVLLSMLLLTWLLIECSDHTCDTFWDGITGDINEENKD